MAYARLILPLLALSLAAGCSANPPGSGAEASDGGSSGDDAGGLPFDASVPARLTLASAPADPAPWEKIELWHDSSLTSPGESLARRALPANDKVRGAFPADLFVLDGSGGTTSDYKLGDYGHLKSDGYFLLGYAPGWSKASGTPVLLIHGAGDDMNRAWAHPWDIQTPASIAQPGLMQALAAAGLPTFAISFAHVHGDNLTQARLIASAIDIIRARTGAAQVDLVAHSKGNAAACAYLASLHDAWPELVGKLPYRGDVRRYLAIAAPFKGLDTSFRYYLGNLSVIATGSSAPLGFQSAYIEGAWRSYPRWYLGSDLYRGQVQLLHDWTADAEHPVPLAAASATTDANATRDALYFGGSSAFVQSEGIAAAIANAGPGRAGFIDALQRTGLDPRVGISVLYGTNPQLGAAGETADPSDGLVFVASASASGGLARRGARIATVDALHLNHLDLARASEAVSWVLAQLRR